MGVCCVGSFHSWLNPKWISELKMLWSAGFYCKWCWRLNMYFKVGFYNKPFSSCCYLKSVSKWVLVVHYLSMIWKWVFATAPPFVLQIKLISIWKAVPQDVFWKRSKRQLGMVYFKWHKLYKVDFKTLKAHLHRHFLLQQPNAIFVTLKLQLQNRMCKPGAIFSLICWSDIPGVLNMYETWCNFSVKKIALSCRHKNCLCKQSFTLHFWLSAIWFFGTIFVWSDSFQNILSNGKWVFSSVELWRPDVNFMCLHCSDLDALNKLKRNIKI